MADTKISALTDGATAAATDRIPVARSPFASGDNRYVTPAYIKDYILGLANTWTATQTFANVVVGSSNTLAWSTDLFLARDAANTLAQRNGVNAQTFRVYNTYTDASNYERGVFDFSTTANVLTIGTEKLGTGATRNVQFVAGGTSFMDYGITAATALTFVPNNIYMKNLTLGTGNFLTFDGRGTIYPISDGVFRLLNSATTGFTRLVWGLTDTTGVALGKSGTNFVIQLGDGTAGGNLLFGGTTSSFPALKRSSTVLQARLADDTDFAPLQGSLRTNANAVAATPTATHTMVITDAGGTAYRVLCVV